MRGRTPLLLLHPLGVDGSFWDPVKDHLPDMECLSPDLPGHGSESNLPSGSSIHEYADTVVAQLASHPARRFHVAGVSLGGLIAQDIAANHPELVDRLILADTVAVYPGHFQRMWQERATTAREQGLASFLEPTVQLWFTPHFLESADKRAQYVRGSMAAADPDGYAFACEALALVDNTALMSLIEAPTLVACGTGDAPPFRQAVEWFAAELPNATVTWIENAQHAGALEQPAAFAALIADFLAQS